MNFLNSTTATTSPIHNSLLPWMTEGILPMVKSYLSNVSSWIKPDQPMPPSSGVAAAATGLSIAICWYLALVRRYRYKYINELRRKYPDPNIALQDPKVAAEVFDTTLRREFPALHQVSFQMALFRSVTIPSISKLLIATGENQRRPQKREEDSYLILHEMLDVYPHVQSLRQRNPDMTAEEIEAQESRRDHAIARLNEIHSRYRIQHGDFLFQLVLFVNEPIYWINKYGYRKLDQLEINAIYKMWADIADGMKLENYPNSAEKMVEFTKSYSEQFAKYSPACQKISDSIIDNATMHYSKWFRGIIKDVHTCMITPIDCAALGLSRPPRWLKLAYDTCWYLHGYYVRFLKFPRKESYLGTALLPTEHNVFMPQYPQAQHPAYPDGYTFATLGPTKIKSSLCPMPSMRVDTCPVAHSHKKQ